MVLPLVKPTQWQQKHLWQWQSCKPFMSWKHQQKIGDNDYIYMHYYSEYNNIWNLTQVMWTEYSDWIFQFGPHSECSIFPLGYTPQSLGFTGPVYNNTIMLTAFFRIRARNWTFCANKCSQWHSVVKKQHWQFGFGWKKKREMAIKSVCGFNPGRSRTSKGVKTINCQWWRHFN